jgi:hypothetical protein
VRLVCLGSGLAERDEQGEWVPARGDVWVNPDEVAVVVGEDRGGYTITLVGGREFRSDRIDAQVIADALAEVDAQFIELPVTDELHEYNAIINIDQIKAVYTTSQNVCMIEFRDGEVVRTTLSYATLREMPQIVRRGRG